MNDPLAPRSAVLPRLSMMMFLQFFVWGAWYVTVGPFMTAQGMADGIYWAYTVGPIAAIISPFFLGMVADRFFATQRVLGAMHLLGGAALLAAPSVAVSAGQWPFIGILMLHMLCYMPTLGLSNTLAFHNMSSPERQFPLVRVFGTIGWIAANLAISKVFMADTTATQFYVAGGAGLALGLYSFTLPHTPPPSAGKRAGLSDSIGLRTLSLMRDRSFAVFVLCSFLLCIPLSFYYAYAPTFVKDSGFEETAATMSLGQVSEILFMLAMPLCFARLGIKWMLAVGMLAWVVRYGLFSAAADEHVRWMVLGGILLHGICYDFFFVAGSIYVDRKAPPAIRGQAQGFLVLITQGLGMLIGAQLAGALVARSTTGGVIDWQQVWVWPCAFAAVVLVAFGLLFKHRSGGGGPTDAPRGEAPSIEPSSSGAA